MDHKCGVTKGKDTCTSNIHDPVRAKRSPHARKLEAHKGADRAILAAGTDRVLRPEWPAGSSHVEGPPDVPMKRISLEIPG